MIRIFEFDESKKFPFWRTVNRSTMGMGGLRKQKKNCDFFFHYYYLQGCIYIYKYIYIGITITVLCHKKIKENNTDTLYLYRFCRPVHLKIHIHS